MATVSAQGAESPESTMVAANTQERYPVATTDNNPTTTREALPPLVCTGEEIR